ncbi:hypothetical protein [Lichenibacterium ramalinae]|uniref:Uncharacterized protein n=1 Tax=Lichenibacterium ramalinae TaxID=2316527 RepID=A0A4V1RIL6_9HYPH|nr:hypothetical protein [Lichenibacterium ramalinae]RYB04441.1 hypothetical protein D3272_13475 [Lichenibacterium ramalinae]
MEGARWRLILNEQDRDEPGDAGGGRIATRVADAGDAVFKRLADRAERGSYRFVGAALALSCLFALPPVADSSTVDPDADGGEIASLRRDLDDGIGGLRQKWIAMQKAEEEKGRGVADQLAALREQVRLQAEELTSLGARPAPRVGPTVPPMPLPHKPEPVGEGHP